MSVLLNKNNLLKKCFILMGLSSLIYFQNVCAIAIGEIVPPIQSEPQQHRYPACPSWKTIALYLDISNIKQGASPNIWAEAFPGQPEAPDAFHVEVAANNFNTATSWYFSLTNLTASSKEEALEQAKDILNSSDDSQNQNQFSDNGRSHSSECKLFNGKNKLYVTHWVHTPGFVGL